MKSSKRALGYPFSDLQISTTTNRQKGDAAKIKDRTLKGKNGQLVTKCTCHKGYKGYSSVVGNPNFCVDG
jgi:hypothetical protein